MAKRVLAEPAGGLGDAPLVFAGVLADVEWEVPFAVQREDGRQDLTEGVEGLLRLAKALAAAEPLGLGRVLLEPGAGGSDDELAPGGDKAVELLETLDRAGPVSYTHLTLPPTPYV